MYKPGEEVLVPYRKGRPGSIPPKKYWGNWNGVNQQNGNVTKICTSELTHRNKQRNGYLTYLWKTPRQGSAAQPSNKKMGVTKKGTKTKGSPKEVIAFQSGMPIEQFFDEFSDIGFSLIHAIAHWGDENCQFGALCFPLNRLGIYRSAKILHKEIGQFLNTVGDFRSHIR